MERATFAKVVGHKSRKMPRAQVALVARYRSPTAFEFVEEQCSDLSSGGMFIRSTAPAPAGTLLKLECDVDDGQGLIRAVARVVWVRERDAGDEPRGMGVKFVKLEPGGRELIAAVLENLGGDEGAGVQARVSTIPPMRSSQAGDAPASAGETATSSDEAASAPSANRAGRSAERVTMREPLAAEIAAQLATLDRERAEAAKAAAASSASKKEDASATPSANQSASTDAAPTPQAPPAPSATAAIAAAAPTQSSTAKAPDAAPASAKTPPTPPAPPKASAPKITTVGPATSDPKRSGVATHRPSARRGVDMQAVALGAALLVGVVVLAMYARQGSQRSARATQAPAPIAEVEIAKVEPVAAPVVPVMAAAAAHVLQLTTLPSEARVTIGNRVATSPVTLELGVLTAPIEVRAEKEGFEPVTAAIELDRFTEQNGKRIATVMLALPAAAPAPTPVAQAAPTPEPTPPAPSLEVAAPKPRRARRAAEPTTTTTVTMQPLATAPAPASAPTGSIAAALAPAAATVPSPAAPAPTAAAATPAAATPAAATPTAATPAPAPPAAAAPAAKLTRLDAALECVGRGDNACVINTLEGKTRSSRELELLIETYRATGQSTAARRNMRDYVERFPNERRAADYAKQLE